MSNLLYRSAGLLRRFSLQTLAAVPLLLSMQPAQAFSLLGPKTSWMTPENGYRDVGGPMARDHEYRWNVPVLTYGFDASFRERFGTNGVQAVEAAFALLNALPPMDSITDEVLTNSYPLVSSATNAVAAAQGMQDLKSFTLSLVLKQLGLASPEQSAWSVRQSWLLDGLRHWVVVQRNFDPVTRGITASVNGLPYHYSITQENTYFSTTPSVFTTVAAGNQAMWGQSVGRSFEGLTVDDVGGLRYLYDPQNQNMEVLPTEVRGVGGADFVNQAPRPGVNKLQFIPHDANATTGAFLPMTIPFTDRYMANGVSRQQALERAIDRPDFIFSASSLPGLYATTGTAGWTNLGWLFPFPIQEEIPGPGVIQGQVQIGISELGPQVVGDTVEYLQWAGFDGTTIHWSSLTNTVTGPVEGKVPLDIPLYQPSGPGTALRMLLSAEYGALLELQSSGDLANWNRQAVVTNYNRPITWSNLMGETNLFFRVVAPQP